MTTKLSLPQISMLRALRDYGNPFQFISGLAAHGGATQTVDSLKRRGLIAADSEGDWQLTQAGRELINELCPLRPIPSVRVRGRRR